MTRNAHEQARQLIALGESLSDSEQKWLRVHFNECAECRSYSDAASRVVTALRSLPLAADARLVRTTQMRVRFHADRVREARERMWLIALACLSVGISTVFTIPLLWRLFAWMGGLAGVAAPIWEAGFAVFFVTPALVVSLVLLARGTHLTSSGQHARNGK
jgi:predicted anti-sigma-YlaC factor YlaD